MIQIPTRPQIIARTATQLIGTPFRLHGRTPANGLDCIGLCAACIVAAGWETDIPNGYAWRNGDAGRIRDFMRNLGFREFTDDVNTLNVRLQVGDILLTRPAPMQLHLLICIPSGLVHAHAGLRKVVRTSRDSAGNILSVFRFVEA